MIQLPKSLTATIHVDFHYDHQGKPPSEAELDRLSRVLSRAAELDPKLQHFLAQLVDYINHLDQGE